MPILVQNLLTSIRGIPLAHTRYAKSMHTKCAQLRAHESWSEDELKAFQLQALRETVNHARLTVPFYRSYPDVRLTALEDIRQFPILLREQVRQHPSAFVSNSTPPDDLILVRTTGTTGASLTVAHSASLMQQAWAFHMRHWSWLGIKPRDWRLTLFGSRVITPARRHPPYWTYNIAEHQILMSVFHLAEHTADDYIKFLHRHENLVLEGFPSVLAIVADFILTRGDRLPMRIVFTDGEPLYPHMRAKIEAAFQTKVYDTYGNTELCGLIQECEHSNMHLAPEWGYVEILNEYNEPVSTGEEGYFVWTSLGNRVMPLLRYRIGDVGRWQEGRCPCGRVFPLISPTITRDSDLLYHPDGRIFSPRALNQTLKLATALQYCQLVQDRLDHVCVRGVASNDFAQQDLDLICTRLRRILGTDMAVSGELAPEPLTRSGGKMPLIFSLMPSELRQCPTPSFQN